MTLVLATAVFLQRTIWQSRRLDVPTWRSSALAIMVHGIGRDYAENTGEEEIRDHDVIANDASWAGKEKVSELDKWAEGVEVSLRRRDRTGLSYGLVPP